MLVEQHVLCSGLQFFFNSWFQLITFVHSEIQFLLVLPICVESDQSLDFFSESWDNFVNYWGPWWLVRALWAPTSELLSGWQLIEVQVIIYKNVFIQLSSKADFFSLQIINWYFFLLLTQCGDFFCKQAWLGVHMVTCHTLLTICIEVMHKKVTYLHDITLSSS